MHHFWPTGLILTFIVVLPGCSTHPPAHPPGPHPPGQAHQTDAHAPGQAQQTPEQAQQTDPHQRRQVRCPESDQTDCLGQSHLNTRLNMQPPNRTKFVEFTYLIDKQILDTNSKNFIDHSGVRKYESYLAQNIPFEPTERIREQIESRYRLSLKHRGEAHITVVTPPEFERLSSYLRIETINAMVIESIQNLPYQLVCLGIGEFAAADTTMFTFFIVVKSPKLAELRKQIEAAYIQAGGPTPAFTTAFRPHITIGFTHRDLHESDGINKTEAACVSEITTDVSPD